MTATFKKATKNEAKLRLALIGPAGSGKTYSSLNIASGLGEKIALIDTERGSASKYADLFSFDTLELESFNPTTYIEAIQAAEEAGYDVLIIDSLSHAWIGKGGALELVDQATKRGSGGNSFTAWRDVTPLHNALVDAIVSSRIHIIATMRSKTDYVMEANSHGKMVPKKVGMAPVQRDGMEYEFDVVGDLDIENNLIITKTRCVRLTSQVIPKPGKQLSAILLDWLKGVKPTEWTVTKSGDTYLVSGDGAAFEVFNDNGAVRCTCDDYQQANDPKYRCAHKSAVIEHARLSKELDAKAASESAR